VRAVAKRRQFIAAYKLVVLAEAERVSDPKGDRRVTARWADAQSSSWVRPLGVKACAPIIIPETRRYSKYGSSNLISAVLLGEAFPSPSVERTSWMTASLSPLLSIAVS